MRGLTIPLDDEASKPVSYAILIVNKQAFTSTCLVKIKVISCFTIVPNISLTWSWTTKPHPWPSHWDDPHQNWVYKDWSQGASKRV